MTKFLTLIFPEIVTIYGAVKVNKNKINGKYIKSNFSKNNKPVYIKKNDDNIYMWATTIGNEYLIGKKEWYETDRRLTSYAYIEHDIKRLAYECRTKDGFCNWTPFKIKLTAQNIPEKKCVICLQEPITYGILHGSTMHKCLCYNCSRYSFNYKCPICRQRIDDIIRVYE